MRFNVNLNNMATEGLPDADPESQIKYLLSVVSLKERRIRSLELDLHTLGLKKDLKEIELNQAIDGLVTAQAHMKERTRDTSEARLWMRKTLKAQEMTRWQRFKARFKRKEQK